jgi:hypothetical protein
VLRLIAGEDKDALETKTCRGRCSLAAMIRLQGPAGNQSPGAFLLCFRDEEFELPSFVPSKSKPSLVITLN